MTQHYDTLVLSGSSTKGIIFLGALQYLFDNYILKDIKYYIGTSAGSIISYLLIIGYTPVEIMVHICTKQVLEKMQSFNILAMVQQRGAISYSNIHEQLESMTISKIGYLPTLLDLKNKYDKVLVCTTHNISDNLPEYLSYETHPDLPCLVALRMTSNLPLIFDNYQYGGNFYIDGAVSDNFPIDVGEKYGKRVFGITLNPDSDNSEFSTDPDIGVLEYIYKIIFTPINHIVRTKINNCRENTTILKITDKRNIKFFRFDLHHSLKISMYSDGFELAKEFIEN